MDITKIQSSGYNITYIAQPGEHGPRVLVDWRSPFSREATAAIKASFTAAQWETIRLWGNTAPAYLVAAVNAYAAEDPRILCSLVSGLGISRYLVTDGASSILTDYIAAKTLGIELGARRLSTSYGEECVFFGSASPSSNRFGLNYYNSTTSYITNYNGNYHVQNGWPNNTQYHVFKFNVTSGKVLIDDTEYESWTWSTTPSAPLYLFSYLGTGGFAKLETDYLKFYNNESGTMVGHMIPCISNGVYGLLELVSGTFYGKTHGSGAFTITEEEV